jgi:hypothetical protein
MTDLVVALMIASGESALLQSGATSEELSSIMDQAPRETLAWEIQQWGNPEEWAKYSLVMHRMHSTLTCGAGLVEPPDLNDD